MVKHYYILKTIVNFHNEHLFGFYDEQSTSNHKEWMKCCGHDDYVSGDVTKTGDKLSLRSGFSRKTSFKSNFETD